MAAMRPDVILHLDKERDVVIDAKVSLSAYLDYMNAESDETRNRSLRAHVESIRKRLLLTYPASQEKRWLRDNVCS